VPVVSGLRVGIWHLISFRYSLAALRRKSDARCLWYPRSRRDAYIAATGCMVGETHTLQENASRLAHFALEMQRACRDTFAPDGSPVVMRIGLHCGPVVGGIVGGNMLRYQLRGLFLC